MREKTKAFFKFLLVVAAAAIIALATPNTAYAAVKVNSKVIHQSDINTMELYRYARGQGWTMKWSEKKVSSSKFQVTQTYENKKYKMSIIQVTVLNSKKKAVSSWYQGKTQTTKSGVKRALKKYKVK